MLINLVGVNHQSAPLTVREKAAVRNGNIQESLVQLAECVPHGIILSTCNRTEIYTVEESPSAGKAGLDFLRKHLDIPATGMLRYTYSYRDQDAATHLFRVASGLDSMIVGEYEILGQVGNALEAAEKAGMAELPLRHLFQDAIRAGRRVREETGLSKNALSVSSVAVELATNIVGDLKSCDMLVIGAGEAGGLVAKAACKRGIRQILVASRKIERAAALAATLGGSAIDLSNLVRELHTCSIVVTCADAPHWLLTVQQVEDAMKGRPAVPLVAIDIAVPRNIEPAVAQVNNVFLYNIDDLTRITDENRRLREKEIAHAEEIVASEVGKFISWWQEYNVRPVISALMEKANKIRTAQLNMTLKKLHPLTDEEQYNLDKMTEAIVTRLLNEPIQLLKDNPSNSEYVRLIRELFHLNGEKPE